MAQFLLRRIFHAVILVAITLTITFVVLRIAPGDPVTRYVQPGVEPADLARVRHSLGLDAPLHVQYLRWAKSFLSGDFGVSFSYHRPVRELLAETIPRTLLLTTLALGVQVLIGVWVGGVAARHRHRALDHAASGAAVVLYSVPSFYLAYLLIGWCAIDHRWLPTAGLSTPGIEPSGWVFVLDRTRHLVLPVLVLGVASAAGFARFTRGSLVDALAEDYARTARAKGVSERRVVWSHAFRNALPPLLTIAGLSAPFLLGGAVVIETVFAWPGMGALMVDSIGARDYPVVLAVNFVAACVVIAGNLLADVASAWADPRGRRLGAKGEGEA